jgi:hypothetical protein
VDEWTVVDPHGDEDLYATGVSSDPEVYGGFVHYSAILVNSRQRGGQWGTHEWHQWNHFDEREFLSRHFKAGCRAPFRDTVTPIAGDVASEQVCVERCRPLQRRDYSIPLHYAEPPRWDGARFVWDEVEVQVGTVPKGRRVVARVPLEAGLLIPYASLPPSADARGAWCLEDFDGDPVACTPAALGAGPGCLLNEASPGETYNCCFLMLSASAISQPVYPCHHFTDVAPYVALLRPLAAGEELMVYYGSGYPRSYPIAAPTLAKEQERRSM